MKRSMTVKAIFGRKVAGVLLAMSAAFVALTLAPHATPATLDDASEGRPLAVGSPAELIERHHCVKPAEGTLPSGVVLSEGRDPAFSSDPVVVGRALDQAVGGVDNGIDRIHSFCV